MEGERVFKNSAEIEIFLIVNTAFFKQKRPEQLSEVQSLGELYCFELVQ